MTKRLPFILPILVLLGLWHFFTESVVLISPAVFPPPLKVFFALTELIKNGSLIADVSVSLTRLVVGLGIGSMVGIVLGLLTGRSLVVSKLISPLIQLFRPLPPVALIPLFIIWFGIEDGAKIMAIAFAVFFPVWINTHSGAERVPKIFLWSGRLLTVSKWKNFFQLLLPATLPSIIVGVRIAIATAFIMLFVTELAGASSGLGYRISIAQLAYRMDQMIAALIVLGLLGALVDQGFSWGTKRILPWLRFSS